MWNNHFMFCMWSTWKQIQPHTYEPNELNQESRECILTGTTPPAPTRLSKKTPRCSDTLILPDKMLIRWSRLQPDTSDRHAGPVRLMQRTCVCVWLQAGCYITSDWQTERQSHRWGLRYPGAIHSNLSTFCSADKAYLHLLDTLTHWNVGMVNRQGF